MDVTGTYKILGWVPDLDACLSSGECWGKALGFVFTGDRRSMEFTSIAGGFAEPVIRGRASFRSESAEGDSVFGFGVTTLFDASWSVDQPRWDHRTGAWTRWVHEVSSECLGFVVHPAARYATLVDETRSHRASGDIRFEEPKAVDDHPIVLGNQTLAHEKLYVRVG